MKKTLLALILASTVFFLFCCGKKGPIFPPLVHIPKPIEEFVVFQRGANVILNWNNPEAYVDGSPIEEITRVEIWRMIESDKDGTDTESELNAAEEEGQREVEQESEDQGVESKSSSAENFSEKAKLVISIAQENFFEYQNKTQDQRLLGGFTYSYPLSSEDLKGQTNTFGLKVWAQKKESDFSALRSIKPKALPCPPTGLTTKVLEDKIQIQWMPPDKNIDDSAPASVNGYTVYRGSEGEGIRCVSPVLITETEFFDSEFEFDEAYTYYVRTSASESAPFLESDNSEPVNVVPKDTFPPKTPGGLVAISGDDFVSLSWDINREQDLAGYRIWRKTGKEKKYTALGEVIRENVFNDTAVRRDQRYDYAVSAVDKSGNESQKSKSISIVPGRGLT